MRFQPKRWSVLLVAGLLLAGLVTVQSTVTAPSAQAVWTPPTDCRQTKDGLPPATPPPATPDNFTPVDGRLGLNNPIGPRKGKRVNTETLLRAINSTPTCEIIRLATWNFRSPETARALKKAMQRGVTVHILMSSFNDPADKRDEYYNPTWKDLRDYITKSNIDPTTPSLYKNRATVCTRACRFNGGAAHSKYYMFSRVGNATGVVFYGSHNLTDVAAYFQWNDLLTVVRPFFYDQMGQIFAESLARQKQANPFRRINAGDITMDVYPYQGKGRPSGTDPVMQVLNRVKCTNAGNVGVKGRTALRLSVAAILYSRGQMLANKLVALKRQGCDIKVLTTNVGFNAMKSLQRAGVPLRQLTRYDDRQRRYTFFTHTKFVTVNGNYAGKPNTRIVWNGSANWTNSALFSDELFAEVRNPKVVNAYNKFVNTWYVKTPMGRRVVPTTSETEARYGNDPWANVEKDY